MCGFVRVGQWRWWRAHLWRWWVVRGLVEGLREAGLSEEEIRLLLRHARWPNRPGGGRHPARRT